MGWGHLKIFFSRTTEPEWVIFTWKLSDIMQIQNCSHHGPWGSGGATIGKTIFMYAYIEKNLLQNQLANFNQTWQKSSLGKGNSKLFK
jgi:hypothetical protein